MHWPLWNWKYHQYHCCVSFAPYCAERQLSICMIIVHGPRKYTVLGHNTDFRSAPSKLSPPCQSIVVTTFCLPESGPIILIASQACSLFTIPDTFPWTHPSSKKLCETWTLLPESDQIDLIMAVYLLQEERFKFILGYSECSSIPNTTITLVYVSCRLTLLCKSTYQLTNLPETFICCLLFPYSLCNITFIQ